MNPLIHPVAETAGRVLDATITANPLAAHVGAAKQNTLPDRAAGAQASPELMVIDVPTFETNTEFTGP